MWITGIWRYVLGLSLLSGCADSAKPSPPTESMKKSFFENKSDRYFVPEYVSFYQPAVFVNTIPWVDDTRMRQALRFIIARENTRPLQTPPDKLNFALAREFIAGAKPFITIQKNAFLGTLDCRLAFDPETNEILYGKIQATLPLLAASLYHELQHMNDLARDANASRCDLEAAAYAAQIRFMVALITDQLLPNELSAIETSDAGVLQMVYESWRALRENRFCAWYAMKIKNGPAFFEQTNSVFDLKK